MLKIAIADLDSTPITTVENFKNAQVTIPLKDTQTAQFSVSIYDPVLKEVKPGRRLIYISYFNMLLYAGYLTLPRYNAAEGTVEINSIDATLRPKHHYHQYGDVVVDVGYPIDGLGFRLLLESTRITTEQEDAGVPDMGIVWGTDTCPHQGPQPPATGDYDPDDYGLWSKAERGSNCWETMQNLASTTIGPDFYFEPISSWYYPGRDVPPPAGYFMQAHTYPPFGFGTNRTGVNNKMRFDFGHGVDNLADFVYEPDVEQVRNYVVEVSPGGETPQTDSTSTTDNTSSGTDNVARKAIAKSSSSMIKYGIFEQWESAQQTATKRYLQDRANSWRDAYKEIPDYFSIVPKRDASRVPRFKRDYFVGDVIIASCRKGYFHSGDIEGRITTATVSQVSPTRNTKVELTCVPNIGVPLDTTPPTDTGGGGDGEVHDQ